MNFCKTQNNRLLDDEERQKWEQNMKRTKKRVLFPKWVAQRLVEWVIDHGHTKEEAYEALAFTVGAAVEKRGDD